MNSTSLAQLQALGISKPKAIYALREFDNNAEIAADWCFTEGAEWTPNDLLQTSHTPTSALSADSDQNSSSSSFARSFPSSSERQIHLPPGWTLVPSRLLNPGTPVAITLKQDQGTDRTVQGIVKEKLSRGDHPRGVKVRLRDGRVGRVVRLLKGSEAEAVLGNNVR
ncbi:uncharacterized protein JCM6883_004889 [Sporobolomyces salmoneus]|uniref:uncharacterized protein n=1 Tax=Sporobolomyces salmoneus TaxID=183962 RepID=UPI00316DF0B5